MAGKGTRFLPYTKEIPKEMLPILNYPAIHYVVSEAIRSGITEIILITARDKNAIENYFAPNLGLETFLSEKGKVEELSLVQDITKMANVTAVLQKEALGLGHAILQAKTLIDKDESFAVLLPDEIMDSTTPVTQQLMDVSEKLGGKSVIGVMNVRDEDVSRYGIVDGNVESSRSPSEKLPFSITGIQEKPDVSEAKTNLAIPGRYILSYDIFSHIEKLTPGSGGELQLTDALGTYLRTQELYAYEFFGARFDTGNLQGFLQAFLHFAAKDERLRPELHDFFNKTFLN